MRVYIDFEFNGTSQKDYNLVCASFVAGKSEPFEFWLHNSSEDKKELKRALTKLQRQGATFVCYGSAEPRAFCALGLNPLSFKWIDLYLEWRMLTNNWNKYAYGDQLKDGKVIKTNPPKPKWLLSEEEIKDQNFSKPSYSLAACTYKLLGIQIDTDEKTKMRDLIISAPPKFSKSEQKAIQEYCTSDVVHLRGVLNEMLTIYNDSNSGITEDQLLLRGDYSARTALMERTGYPVNVIATRNFVDQLPAIMKDMCEDIVKQFPKNPPFYWNKKRSKILHEHERN